jgi:hypothetical protein
VTMSRTHAQYTISYYYNFCYNNNVNIVHISYTAPSVSISAALNITEKIIYFSVFNSALIKLRRKRSRGHDWTNMAIFTISTEHLTRTLETCTEK